MSRAYFNKTGVLKYDLKDDTEKCFDSSEICKSSINNMACRTNWWRDGYWGGWWGWGYGYWGVYGDNLTYLYTEIEALEAFRCGTINHCAGDYYSSQYCDDLAASSCGKPRIARCKTYGCVSDFNTNNYCSLINGKDREERCCTAPSNFECKEGECDYDYEIVKKEYTVEYELVKPSYSCKEKTPYPESACIGHFGISKYSSQCQTSRSECSTDPEAKCDRGYSWWYGAKCPPEDNPPPEGYGAVASDVTSVSKFWELDDCDCGFNEETQEYTCPSCYDCEDFEDCNYDLREYNTGWFWYGYNGYIGDDCCFGGLFGPSFGYYSIGPCPIDAGDGSDNPWWCNGTDCEQKKDGDEDESDTGPYTSYKKCMEECFKDETGGTNKCIPESKSYTRGYCCDSKFIENMQDAIDNKCSEEGPKYTKTTKETLCNSSNCSNDLIYEREDDMCTYSTKYCKSHQVTQTKSNVRYGYEPPIQDKAYFRICASCNKESNDECEADPLSKCPANTDIPVLKEQVVYKGEEVTESVIVKLIMVFCKITTKECVPVSSEE